VCEEVIESYHDKPTGQDNVVLQVRYADTEDQKKLKYETAKRRQFRTNEYNAVAHGGGVFQTLASPVVMANFARPPLSQLEPQIGNNWRSPRAINTPIKQISPPLQARLGK